MSASKLELECTNRCRLLAHGNAITATMSVRDASEEAMATHIRNMCANFCQITDEAGRTALHMAATCGNSKLVQWLAQLKECNVNAKDVENGFTPLHRSVFYGQIHVAVNLIQLGASVIAVDGDELTAVEHAMLDRPPIVDLDRNGPCEVYVWGTNANYTLGTGSQHIRQLPELLEAFRKQNISIKQVSMHKFHSVFVSHDGTAHSCGHGQGGRLGLGTEQAVITPRLINLPTESCVAASVSRDHTVLLTESGAVFTCGLNLHHQLGINPPPSHVLTPTPLPPRVIKAVGTVVGIFAARFHTVVWGSKVILTFGLHAGQLGHPKSPDKTIVKPKAVTALHLKDSSIIKVCTSDGAVVVATDKGQVFLLHEYECTRIASRQMDVAKLVVVGGKLDSRVDKEVLSEQGGSSLQVLLLTTSGRIMIWQDGLARHFTRCSYTLNRLLLVHDVAMTQSQVLVVTRDGEAFCGEIRPRKVKKISPDQSPKPPTSAKHLERADCEILRVSKLPHIHRAVSITSDVKGRNFAVIQCHPKQALFDIPQLETSSLRDDMKTLLSEASEDDNVHDVIFQIGFRKFPAHQFIISSRNDHLGKLIAEQAAQIGQSQSVVTVRLENIEPDVFQQLLQYIYTNECDMMTLGSCPLVLTNTNKIKNDEVMEQDEEPTNTVNENLSAFAVYSAEKKKTKKNKLPAKKNNSQNDMDPVIIVQKHAKRFNMQDLCVELNGFAYEDGFIVPKGKRQAVAPPPRWSRQANPHLQNVVIRSETGRELRAHKCILTSRLEYFNSMFCQGWSEAKHSVKLALPYSILEILIDFLYEDAVSADVRDSEDLDLLSNLLVVADQLFVTRLKEQCEVSLVNVLTLKTVAELLQLSETYLAVQLKRCCMQYICFNLSAVLESRSLEGVSPKLLSELSGYYIDLNPVIQKRALGPSFYAPSVETLQAALKANPFSFEMEDLTLTAEGDVKKVGRQTKKKPKVHRTSTDGGNAVNRVRQESTGSVTSDDGDQIQAINFDDLVEKTRSEETQKENIDKHAQWVKVPTNKNQKIIQARLRAINAAKDPSFIVESSRESFTQLSRNSQSPVAPVPTSPDPKILAVKTSPQPSVPIPVKPVTAFDFPELCSPPNVPHHKSVPRHVETKKMVKVSQKQRKRMTSLNDVALMGDYLETINRSSPAPAWGRQSPESEAGGCSLVDIIRQEFKHVRVTQGNDPAVLQRKAPEESRKVMATNPWGKISTKETVAVKKETKTMINFTDIIANEKKEKDNLVKMLAKPLELTQIEDQAISDLLQFYNASKSSEERITVQRLSRGPIATPTWITNH